MVPLVILSVLVSFALWFMFLTSACFCFCVCLSGFWEVPSTASLHSGVHPGSQRAERWDGGRQEVRPQVRNCTVACVTEPYEIVQPCLIRVRPVGFTHM